MSWMIWPGNPALSAIVLFLMALPWWFVLEVKTAGAKLLSHQVERIAACHRKWLPTYVVHTPEEALQVIGATH